MPADGESLEQVLRFMAQVPFNQVLGLTIEALESGFCRMALPFREELIGDPFRRALHGGVLSAMADTCGGACLWTQCEAGDSLSTVDLRVDYLRPGRCQTVFCDGRVLRLGNRVGVAEMLAYHPGEQNEPIVTAKGVYNIRRT